MALERPRTASVKHEGHYQAREVMRMPIKTIDSAARTDVKPDADHNEIVLDADVVEETLAYDIMLKQLSDY